MTDKAFRVRAWTLTESGWHTIKKATLCNAPFVWCTLQRRVEACKWSRAVLTGNTSQQDCFNMRRATVISIPLMHILWMFVKDVSSTFCKERLSLKTEQVLQRRCVSKCAIDVIFYISFQGLPYRSKHREAVATAFDESNHDNRRNHENVWHVIMLCCYYQHVSMNSMSLKFSNLFLYINTDIS